MIVRCQECGGTHIFDLGFKVDTEELDASAVNGNDQLNLETLPYYIGGYYCADCQTFCSTVEEPEPADEKPISDKQRDFMNKLLKRLNAEHEWPQARIDRLSQKEAGRVIWNLKRRCDRLPKKAPAPATDKQKNFLKTLIEKSAHNARYATLDIDAMNVVEAAKWISELVEEAK